MFAICFNRTIKHKRFRTYIHKQKSLEKMCAELIDNHDPHHVIFAYGMGGLNMRTRSYKPSPSKHRRITSRLIKLGALVVNVNEYNTYSSLLILLPRHKVMCCEIQTRPICYASSISCGNPFCEKMYQQHLSYNMEP